jgi:hypothetical protein
MRHEPMSKRVSTQDTRRTCCPRARPFALAQEKEKLDCQACLTALGSQRAHSATPKPSTTAAHTKPKHHCRRRQPNGGGSGTGRPLMAQSRHLMAQSRHLGSKLACAMRHAPRPLPPSPPPSLPHATNKANKAPRTRNKAQMRLLLAHWPARLHPHMAPDPLEPLDAGAGKSRHPSCHPSQEP